MRFSSNLRSLRRLKYSIGNRRLYCLKHFIDFVCIIRMSNNGCEYLSKIFCHFITFLAAVMFIGFQHLSKYTLRKFSVLMNGFFGSKIWFGVLAFSQYIRITLNIKPIWGHIFQHNELSLYCWQCWWQTSSCSQRTWTLRWSQPSRKAWYLPL